MDKLFKCISVSMTMLLIFFFLCNSLSFANPNQNDYKKSDVKIKSVQYRATPLGYQIFVRITNNGRKEIKDIKLQSFWVGRNDEIYSSETGQSFSLSPGKSIEIKFFKVPSSNGFIQKPPSEFSKSVLVSNGFETIEVLNTFTISYNDNMYLYKNR